MVSTKEQNTGILAVWQVCQEFHYMAVAPHHKITNPTIP